MGEHDRRHHPEENDRGVVLERCEQHDRGQNFQTVAATDPRPPAVEQERVERCGGSNCRKERVRQKSYIYIYIYRGRAFQRYIFFSSVEKNSAQLQQNG